PDWTSVAYGSVWVAVDEAGEVARIDPASNQVAATVEVGGHPCTGLAAGFGAVWSPSCTDNAIYRIDARTEKVEAVIEIPVFQSFSGEGPFGGITTGAAAVWTITEGKAGSFDVLARIDPRTDEVAATFPLGYPVGEPTFADGSIWVLAPEDDRVLRVDPRSGEVIAEVKGLAQPAFMAAGKDALWVLSGTWGEHPFGDGSVTRIDTATNAITARIRIDEIAGTASNIAVGEGFVWARTGRTVLVKIDPSTNEIVERVDEPRGAGGVEIGFGSLWLSDFTTDHVWRVAI
ncbi:MAG TPA: hypothetical protein VIG64_14810, partial [Actinomycetota bacterium]